MGGRLSRVNITHEENTTYEIQNKMIKFQSKNTSAREKRTNFSSTKLARAKMEAGFFGMGRVDRFDYLGPSCHGKIRPVNHPGSFPHKAGNYPRRGFQESP